MTLRLGCIDTDAPPLFSRMQADGVRPGYEPAAALHVCAAAGRDAEWVILDWSDFYPALDEQRIDAIWCGQGITPPRQELGDFTIPYTIFDESVVVRADNPAVSIADLAGARIGAIAGSANMRLAETFPDVELVAFPGTADVFGDMIEALRAGDIDGFVDDDVAMIPLDDEPDLRLAFTVATRLPWGAVVRKGNDALRAELDAAIARSIADGSLAAIWRTWIPGLAFPL